ncbi:hypothetical protein NH340_JMT08272 [Sarcoptes scabiei]|nr:hypothetical protein NH340_JMT08272 [Sarcoptes scabiei]
MNWCTLSNELINQFFWNAKISNQINLSSPKSFARLPFFVEKQKTDERKRRETAKNQKKILVLDQKKKKKLFKSYESISVRAQSKSFRDKIVRFVATKHATYTAKGFYFDKYFIEIHTLQSKRKQ